MKSRKFIIALAVSVIFLLAAGGGMILAARGINIPWIASSLAILASTFPAYMGANALSKKKKEQ